jgi:hypothetical protein
MKKMNEYFTGLGAFTFGMMVLADGFRGVKWGAHINDLSGLEYWSQEKGITYYTKKGDCPEIGGINLSAVLYGFRRSRLVCVNLIMDGGKNFSMLERALSDRFGKATALPSDSEKGKKFAWMKDVTVIILEKKFIIPTAGESASNSLAVTLKIYNLKTVFEPAWAYK